MSTHERRAALFFFWIRGEQLRGEKAKKGEQEEEEEEKEDVKFFPDYLMCFCPAWSGHLYRAVYVRRSAFCMDVVMYI